MVIFSPTIFLFHDEAQFIPPTVWRLILLTGAVQAAYYIFLAKAYQSGDISHAYPLARSMPVVFVALISLLLGRGDQIGGLAYAGFIIVTAGCLLLPMSKFNEIRLKNYRQSWILFALLAPLCISGYTLMDDQALRVLRSLPGTDLSNLGWSLLFVELEAISITVFLAVFLSFSRNNRREMVHPGSGGWRMALLMGAIISGTYSMVLLAMAYVNNVSYVIAFRQLSIPIGALLGILAPKESNTAPKLLGITLVFIGLVLAALG